MPRSSDIEWVMLPFDFHINWVLDLQFGWLEFCWFDSYNRPGYEQPR